MLLQYTLEIDAHRHKSLKKSHQDLSWTSWTSWTICSANCGVSYRQRTRSCVNGQYGGPQCAVPYEEEQKACTVFENCQKSLILSF